MTLLISPRSGNAGDLVDVARAGAELLLVVDSSTLPPPTVGSDDVINESDAPGATVSDALNGIGGAVATLTTDGVANESGTVPGLTASDALDALQEQFDTLAADTAGTGLHATGVNPQELTTRIRPRLVQLADYFTGGLTTSGNIGQLGWTLGTGVGTPSVNRITGGNFSTAPQSRLGIVTSATTNDRTSLMLATGESGAASALMRPTELNILQTLVQVPTLTTRRFFFGLSEAFNAAPSAMSNSLGFIYDSGVSPNWQIIARSASAGAAVVTTQVATTNAELLSIVRIADDNYEFWIGNTLVGTILAGVADTTNMNVGFQLTNLATGPTAQVNVGYFGLQAVGSGVLAADTFLQG